MLLTGKVDCPFLDSGVRKWTPRLNGFHSPASNSLAMETKSYLESGSDTAQAEEPGIQLLSGVMVRRAARSMRIYCGPGRICASAALGHRRT